MNSILGALRSPRRLAVLAVALTGVVLVLVGQAVDPRATSGTVISLTAAIAVSFTAMAALVLMGMPGHRVGRLMAAVGITAGLAVLAASWASWLPLAWLSQWLQWPPLPLILLALLLFPDGRLLSARWRPLAVLIVAASVVATVALAVAAVDHPRTLIAGVDLDRTDRAQALLTIAKVAVVLVGAGTLGVAGSLWARWRRADGDTRGQLACLLLAVVPFVLALVLEAYGFAGAFLIAAAAVPMAMTVAVLRYRLYGLDRIINRTLVWLVMTLLVIVGFIALVALLRDALMGGDASTASLVATGLIAITFDPARRQVQRHVDRLLYGERDDPYRVIARLGDLLGKTMDPGAVLPLLAREIAHSMQVPYVGVELTERGCTRLLAEHGVRTTTVEEFAMVAHGEPVGRLLVGVRTVDGHFTRRERRLLADAALHAAVAAEATRLIRDLQASRERLIRVREEERRRLRRDLHDNIGPNLTGMAMQVRAARKAVGDPNRVGALLDGLAGDLQLCTLEVRQLVDQLGPPELDAGLAAALRAACRRFDSETLSVDLQVADNLDGLPGAVEVAAYRIVGEALNNVVRHAQARTCRITVDRMRSLALEIVDDGVGIAPQGRRGVGLSSMRERALELGGDCEVGAAEPRGTAVRVNLPLAPTGSHLQG